MMIWLCGGPLVLVSVGYDLYVPFTQVGALTKGAAVARSRYFGSDGGIGDVRE